MARSPDPAPPTVALPGADTRKTGDAPTLDQRPQGSDPGGTLDLQTGAGTGAQLQRVQGSAASAGMLVGRYEVIREIGRGGMGSVYLAQDLQFKRQVAVKLLRPGRDGGSITRRFEAERQILAGLDHPHIARLLDGGETSDGHPYLVMEYIEGQGLARFCDARRLDTAARVDLFLKVASAVHFAHQHLVVHRDIKPGNVLVADDGTPKLLDFGIAKLLDPEAAGMAGDLTQADERLMTPAYASPEQVHGQPVTTASDVYALGVLLYELLTGRLPYTFRDYSLAEIVRVVGTVEPLRPSAAVLRAEEVRTAAGEPVTYAPAEAAATRDGAPDRLARRLRGDVDEIVLRALRKEPGRRYLSVQQLAEDLERWRAGRPVLAHGDSRSYRLGKFVRRNRAPVAAGALVFLSLVGGVIATVRQARIAERERARAERRFEEVRSLARAVVFKLHDAIADLPGSTPARKVLVEEALHYLDGLAREAEGDLGLERELAQAYERVGDVQGRPATANLGDTEGALASYRKAVSTWEAVVAATSAPADRRGLARSVARMGEVQGAAEDGAGALESQKRAVALLEEVLAAEPADVATRKELAQLHTSLGDALARTGQVPATLQSRARAIDLLDGLWAEGVKDDELLRTRGRAYQKRGNNLGNPSFSNAGDTAGALRDLERAAAIYAELATRPGPPSALLQRLAAVCRSNLSDVLLGLDRADEALVKEKEALVLFQAIADADPKNEQAKADVAIAYEKIGELRERARDYRGALQDFGAALEIHRAQAASDPDNAQPRRDMALMLLRQGMVRIRLGSVDAGLAEMERGHAVNDELTKADPGNAEQRFILAYAAWNVGDGHAAAAEKATGSVRRARWQSALSWFERALPVLQALEKEGALTGSDLQELKNVEDRIAKARAALAPARP